MNSNFIIYYIHDPMCSWCWGFRPTWHKVLDELNDKATIRYVLGGLAADTDQPMPDEMQVNIQEIWRLIQKEIPGTQFNLDFWKQCHPRRSTYASCRAIISATNQQSDIGNKMLLAIQQSYYLEAKNPSDDQVLIELAKQLNLNIEKFTTDLNSTETHKKLLEEFELRRRLDIQSFPSIVLEHNDSYTYIDIDYNNADNILKQINNIL
jgi:putative protein-disulfide isomerase